MTPLEMARNLVTHVDGYARAAENDPVQAHIAGVGAKQHASAEMAGHLALVSIAEDLHQITTRLMKDWEAE